MTTSPTTSSAKSAMTRGSLTSFAARNRHHFYDLIVSEFKKSGLTQAELAARIGMDAALLSRILSRPRNLELDTISKIIAGTSERPLVVELERRHQAAAIQIANYLATGVKNDTPQIMGAPMSAKPSQNSIDMWQTHTNDNALPAMLLGRVVELSLASR